MAETNLIEDARAAAERLEHANKINEELVKRMEAIEARRVLGGQSEAVQKAIEVTEAQRIRMDTLAYFKGTPVEEALRKYDV